MATLDETCGEFIVQSSETADSDVSRDESYADDCADEYESEFDADERTSPRSPIVSAPSPIAPASLSPDVDPTATLDVQSTASTALVPGAERVKASVPPSRLPVWVGTTKQVAIPSSVPASPPVSHLSATPSTATPSIPTAAIAAPTSTGPSPPGRAATASTPSASKYARAKAVSSSAPSSKPPSRGASKPASSTATPSKPTTLSRSSSSASSPAAARSPTRSAAFDKSNNSAHASSASSPAHKSSKPAFDFSAAKSEPRPPAATHSTAASSSAPDSAPLSPRLAQLHREARWDPTPFTPPVVPLFATSAHKPASQPLLDVKQSAWQLQKPRALPAAPNVLLRKPRSEVATRMSDVVMRTRQLRRRTKDKASAALVGRGKEGRGVAEASGTDAIAEGEAVTPTLRLAVGEQAERGDERRTRHNSPLARGRVSGSR